MLLCDYLQQQLAGLHSQQNTSRTFSCPDLSIFLFQTSLHETYLNFSHVINISTCKMKTLVSRNAAQRTASFAPTPKYTRRVMPTVCKATNDDSSTPDEPTVNYSAKIRDAYSKWKTKRQELEKERLSNIKDIHMTIKDIFTEEIDYVKNLVGECTPPALKKKKCETCTGDKKTNAASAKESSSSKSDPVKVSILDSVNSDDDVDVDAKFVGKI